MYVPTLPTQGSRNRSNIQGKIKPVSFGYHELHLIDVWKELAEDSGRSDSGEFKNWLRMMKNKRDEQRTLLNNLQGVTL